ncbi:MAG: TRAP transporter small permease subunit [Proteobacteria bacterium]|nr:TRAP transporter small permease subunit [Pseudomonadota bacterium]
MLERLGLYIACVSCALLAFLSLLEVLCRFLGVDFYLASEIDGFLMGWLIFFALATVTRTGAHISVDFLVKAASPRVRAWMELFGHLITLAYLGVLIVLCGQVTYRSWDEGLRAQGLLRTPTFYPYLGIMVGFALAFISQAVVLLGSAKGVRSPSRDAAQPR